MGKIAMIGLICIGLVAIATAAPKGCLHNGKMYKEGEKVSTDPCSPCFCSTDGLMSCMVVDCITPSCVDSIKSPNHCCSTCPNGANCYLPDGSTILKHGASKLMADGTTCKCASMFGLGFGTGLGKSICAKLP
ncbi:hypothetical protein SNE40_004741 [Patella caerulea]|uniref:VWFC domain-containing protein n=1 Tax=Patella caerulea TaxID=87958 RepID=A0AAN8KCL1_PATCE